MHVGTHTHTRALLNLHFTSKREELAAGLPSQCWRDERDPPTHILLHKIRVYTRVFLSSTDVHF